MALWAKDTVTRAPMTVYHRAETGPDGLIRIVYNPDDGGVVALVHNQIGGQAATQESLEALLQMSGGIAVD